MLTALDRVPRSRGGELMDLYQELILEHSKRPPRRAARALRAEVHHVNPTCGDEVTLRVHVEGGGQTPWSRIAYDALGCSISTASTTVLAEEVIGHTVAEALRPTRRCAPCSPPRVRTPATRTSSVTASRWRA